MTSKLKLLVATSAFSVAMLGATPAFAVGTDAGVPITNSVNITYNVGGAAQTPPPVASDTFVVDRKVNLLVQRFDAIDTPVAPNQTGAAVAYTVTNLTNDTIDVILSAEQTGGDDFDSTGAFTYYTDVNQDGLLDGGDTILASGVIDNLAEDAIAYILVTSNIPTNNSSASPLANGETGDVILIGQAANAATGTAFSDDAGNVNAAGTVQNVFADADGPGSTDVAGATALLGDGRHSAIDTYVVDTATLSVAKTSVILWDPINGSTNPKAIPGAIVQYCIAVSNASTTVAATNVAISDSIAALALTYYGTTVASGPATIPTATAAPTSATACDGTGSNPDASALSHSSGVISGNLGNVAASSTETLIFRATVN
ncbi:hypothetical protein [Parasphingorhabdus halotolerans]|uniref:DUF11 domain-containing protein n=1 Tax=Parasphingorhabdus halotolerans TaxID=2725558 RepID=A0A6H2DHB2_9SPHN|nr:hypothetical protein [Parasphingorhabdus halotolerans]QJB68062.1 hypothetical protein HF685_01030 [Parasphingorhabdus halotolerans]